jgi:hypothetical protein
MKIIFKTLLKLSKHIRFLISFIFNKLLSFISASTYLSLMFKIIRACYKIIRFILTTTSLHFITLSIYFNDVYFYIDFLINLKDEIIIKLINLLNHYLSEDLADNNNNLVEKLKSKLSKPIESEQVDEPQLDWLNIKNEYRFNTDSLNNTTQDDAGNVNPATYFLALLGAIIIGGLVYKYSDNIISLSNQFYDYLFNNNIPKPKPDAGETIINATSSQSIETKTVVDFTAPSSKLPEDTTSGPSLLDNNIRVRMSQNKLMHNKHGFYFQSPINSPQISPTNSDSTPKAFNLNLPTDPDSNWSD